MLNTTGNRADREAERKAQEKARQRAEVASIVAGLQTILEGDEQLLAFARGRLAGGWRGKLSVGPEAFFAPYVNIGLTERRFILQHIHPENGRPSEILPHFFPLSDIAALTFTDIETFGNAPACRLILRQNNEQHFRLRLEGAVNFENAKQMAEVFQSLTSARRTAARPTQSVCAHCGHVLDQPSKFCPYCGQRRTDTPAPPEPTNGAAVASAPPSESSAPEPPAFVAPAPSEAPDVETPPTPPVPDVAVSAPPSAWFETPVPDTLEAPFGEEPHAPSLPEEISPDTARYEQPTSEMLSEALSEAEEVTVHVEPENAPTEADAALPAEESEADRPSPAESDENQTHGDSPSLGEN